MDCSVCQDLERAFESRRSNYIEARSKRRNAACQEQLGGAQVSMLRHRDGLYPLTVDHL